MNKDFILLAPTKGRPDAYAELLASFEANNSQADIIPIVDSSEIDIYPPGLVVDGNLVQKLNVGAKYALEHDYKYIGWLADDVVIHTPDFDRLIVKAYEENPHIKIIHCADWLHNGRIANHWVLRADVVGRLGWFIHPDFKHLYIDNFWTSVGIETGTILYLDSVVWEHKHYIVRKRPMDDTYKIANDNDGMEYGKGVFERLTSGETYKEFLKLYLGE